MSRFFVTGDTHSDFRKLNTKNFPMQQELAKDDYLIICGDFGGIWDFEESKREKNDMDWLEEKPFTTLFVDGNHDNFDRLYEMPVQEWKGGKVHFIRPSVIHLMRGQYYDIDGTTFFTFGGAQSHDIQGGVLDINDPNYREKKKKLDREWIPYRINHFSWWKEELPSQEEMAEGLENLKTHNYKVDYIISHCAASCIQKLIDHSGFWSTDILTSYFDEIKDCTAYKKWYFGHYHDNQNVTDKDILVYEPIIELGQGAQEHILGKPKYKGGDLVDITFDGRTYQGRIYVTDPYGKRFGKDQPYYDVVVYDDSGDKSYIEGIREDSIRFAKKEKKSQP